MRTRALSGALLLALSVLPAPTAGQSYTQFDLSYGLFDGVGIGMTHVARVAENPAFGVAVGAGSYGIYSNLAHGRGRSDYGKGYRYAGRYDDSSDWCWDEAWDMRWGRGYYGWRSSYDHLDFYHDCRAGGLNYAYDRWRSHSRYAYNRHYDYYDAYYGRGRRDVVVSVYVKDSFWRPWGPYWSYDPWGWYWEGYGDGYRDGRRDGRWGRTGGVVYAGGFGGGRPSPLAPTRFKEDPRVVSSGGDARRAQPRGAAVVAPAAPARASGRPGVSGGRDGSTNAPAPVAPRRGERPTAAGRPTDRVRTTDQPARGGSQPALQPDGGATRARPSAPAGSSERARPSAPAVREGTSHPAPAPAQREREAEEPRRSEPVGRPAPAPRSEADRPAARQPSSAPTREPARAPAAERAPESRRPTEAAPAARSGGGSTRAAPEPRSDGGSTRSAPATRRPATR